MIRIQTFSAGAAAGLIMAAGFAFAQNGLMPNPRMDREVVAAQDALQEAMEHLAKARFPNSNGVTRAKAYIALAHTELVEAGGLQGLLDRTRPE
jgi:spore germination cell wall hydrolase CwlJ-like protein